MDYEVIIIGATFSAAGMLEIYGEKCLILERRPEAGYEFISAMKPGDFSKFPETKEATEFLYTLSENGLFTEYGVNIFNTASTFYSYLQNKNIFLNMEITGISEIQGGFKVSTFGVSGIREFTAKKVIDTTPRKDNIKSKAINILTVQTDKNMKPMQSFGNITVKDSGLEYDRICSLPLSAKDDYITARGKIYDFTLLDEFKGYALESIAGYFDISVKDISPKEIDGITYLPSCGYENPVLAFDAGVKFAMGGKNQ